MELNMIMNNAVIKKTAYECSVEQPIESDITLPEYFPDIVRVLRATLNANISSVNATGDRITAEGNAVLSVVYISDDMKMHCFEQRIPYSKFTESKEIEGCSVCANANTQYVNCRVVSQRRLDVHASITICFKAYEKSVQSIVKTCENKTVQIKKDSVSISNLRDSCVKNFTLSETLEVGASQGSIGQIIRNDAVAIVNETKLVAGKILIKGELIIKTLYLTETDSVLQKIENNMPISQIIEADTADDSTDIVNLFVSGLEVFAKTDSSGALRLIDVTAVIRADIDIYENMNIECVTDTYSTEYELMTKKSAVEMMNICEKLNDTYLCRGTIDLSGSNISSVLDMNCTDISSSTEILDNELIIKGTVTVNLLAMDGEEQIVSYERQFDYEYKKTVSNTDNDIKCIPDIMPTGVSYMLSSESKIDVRVEAEINAVIFSSKNKMLISDIAADETKPKSRKFASLTIYFAESGENVWDIARKYNTTVDAVKTENNLSADALTENCKLLIPGA